MARVNITIGEEIEKRIEYYAKYMGMSKSNLCAYLVAQGVMGFDKAYEISKEILTDVANKELTTK